MFSFCKAQKCDWRLLTVLQHELSVCWKLLRLLKKCFTSIHVKSGAQNRFSVPSWLSELSIERCHNPPNESTSTIIILPTANAVWKTFCYRSVHRNKDLIDSGWNEFFNKTLNASLLRFMCFSICGKLFTFLLVHWVVKRINTERYVPQKGFSKNTTSMP